MLKIGEFSKLSHVTIKTLRFYDEINLLKPDQINKENGYRYYSMNKLAVVEEISMLKKMNFSLEEIADILAGNPDSSNLANLLLIKREQLLENLHTEEQRIKALDFRLNQLCGTAIEEQVIMRTLPKIYVASCRSVVPTVADLEGLAAELDSKLWRQQAVTANPDYNFSIYHDEEYLEENIDVEVCQSVIKLYPSQDGVVYKKLEQVDKAACLFHRGDYDYLDDTYAKLYQWLADNHLEIDGDIRECYLDGSWNKSNPTDWLTEIQIPVKDEE